MINRQFVLFRIKLKYILAIIGVTDSSSRKSLCQTASVATLQALFLGSRLLNVAKPTERIALVQKNARKLLRNSDTVAYGDPEYALSPFVEIRAMNELRGLKLA
jgi:hypothetical protein